VKQLSELESKHPKYLTDSDSDVSSMQGWTNSHFARAKRITFMSLNFYLLNGSYHYCYSLNSHASVASSIVVAFCKMLLPDFKIHILKGQSHEKVGEMSVWGISLGPN
jgi:hypothetical protein